MSVVRRKCTRVERARSGEDEARVRRSHVCRCRHRVGWWTARRGLRIQGSGQRHR